MAHAYAPAEKAQIPDLGITEHNGVGNVKSLCNLRFSPATFGRWGSGSAPLRGQNNVQGGGDRGAALPVPGLPGHHQPDHRAKFETAYGMELTQQRQAPHPDA